MSKNTGGPAFPTIDENHYSAGGEGMTLRDYFAAKVMQGVLSNMRDDVGVGREETNDRIAACAYAIADAMIKEREK